MPTQHPQDPATTIVVLIILLSIYFFPTTIALLRHHRNTGAICLTNLLLGWIGIGWIVALIWATTANTKSTSKAFDKYPMNDAILQRVNELQAYEDRKDKEQRKMTTFEKVVFASFALFLLLLIFGGKAHAKPASTAATDAYYVCMVGNAALLLKNQGYALDEKDTAFYKTIRRKCEKLYPKMTETEEAAFGDEIEIAITAFTGMGGEVEAAPPAPNKE